MKRLALALALFGCAPDDADPAPPTPLQVGERRSVVLRFTPLDVTRFTKALGRTKLRTLPRDVLARTWLVDLPLAGGAGLVDHALADLRTRDPATLPPAEANLVRLLQMSPTTADLAGSPLEPLLALAPSLGLSAAEILADTLGLAPEETFLSPTDLASALVTQVIGTHPAVAGHPPGHLPVYLDDVLSDLGTLNTRYGPAGAHPGFLASTGSALFGDDLELVVEANVNGVPNQGVDLETASHAGVNSIDDHPESLFDFASDSEWLRIEGTFRDPPVVERLTFTLFEDPRSFSGGTAPDPAPRGGSDVWTAPPWSLERVVAEAAFARWSTWQHTRTWQDGLLEVTSRDGWLSLVTAGEVGEPPAPAYIWDLLLEVAQIRLHDAGVDDASVALALRDVPLGLSMDALIQRVRDGLAADPAGLVAVAARLFDNTWGEADFFYRRPRGLEEDWLFFIAPEDLPPDTPYGWARPGFFADAALTVPLGDRVEVDGDRHHLKLQVVPGLAFYVADEHDQRYRVTVGEKPGRARIALQIERLQ